MLFFQLFTWKISCSQFLAQTFDSTELHGKNLLHDLHSLHPCGLKNACLTYEMKLRNLSFMDVVKVVYA